VRQAIAAINSVLPEKEAVPVCGKDKRAKKAPREKRASRDSDTEEKDRAVGKEKPLHENRTDLEALRPVVPLDQLREEAPAPRGCVESQQAPIDQSSKSTDPPGNVACSNERPRTTTGQEQTTDAFSPEVRAGPEPVSEALPHLEQIPPAPKPPGQIVRLRDLFRAAVKPITARTPAPRPTSRKRRRDEMGGAFRKVALGLLRSVARISPLHFLDPTWEPFTWLRLWDCNDPTGSDVHQDYPAPTPTNHSPHL